MRASLLLVVSVVLLASILGLAWFVGMVLELEYPYFFQIRQAQTATTPGGARARTLLARAYPGERLHWHMCSYCYARASRAGHLEHVQISVSGQQDLYFAYHPASNQMVAMSQRTASLHPEFLPSGDHLVPLGSGLGDGETFVIPSSWWGKR